MYRPRLMGTGLVNVKQLLVAFLILLIGFALLALILILTADKEWGPKTELSGWQILDGVESVSPRTLLAGDHALDVRGVVQHARRHELSGPGLTASDEGLSLALC